MAGQSILIHLLGSVALLIWATRMVKTGILRAFGEELRRTVASATRNPVRACCTGVIVATVLQSSTATGLLLVSFAERAMIALPAALAVMLGADIGSTLVVQVLSLNLQALVPIFLIVGVVAFMASERPFIKQLGRVTVGLALMIMALGLIAQVSGSLRESPLLTAILQRLDQEPLLALIFAALLTWVMHSSVATILFFVALAQSGLLPLSLAIVLVLGANIGSGLIPLGLSIGAGATTRRILFGNLFFRVVGAFAFVWFADPVADILKASGAGDGRAIANVHTLFNLAVALAFLPLTGLASRLLELWVTDTKSTTPPTLPHLDDSFLDTPQLAIAGATREVMRLADLVEMMLRDSLETFQGKDARGRQAISKIDDQVDELQEAIKLYLTRLTRGNLSDEDSRRCFDLILFTTNLEHAGDIIDKSLLELAAKRQKSGATFSPEGWDEICRFHAHVMNQMRRAIHVFVYRDPDLARELIVEKDRLRSLEKEATENHLKRLRDGTLASLETSTIHLDVLRDLKRINAHITSVAYPILEATGELRPSRLRPGVTPPDSVVTPQ